MDVHGEMVIGGALVRGCNGTFQAIDPATGDVIEPPFGRGGHEEVERACALAAAAFDGFRETEPELRAQLLETCASRILKIGDTLVDRAVGETGLSRARIEGERARTVGQLRLFASVVRDGGYLGARIDPAMPDRKPSPRSDLRLRNIPLGPVAVFGASNFPLAFSAAGGDTASALAAGCPVVVKAHSAHPGTSELVGRAVQAAVTECGLHEGVFSLIFGAGSQVGSALVADPRIKAVGFTGSRAGGIELVNISSRRPEPIPVYAEMSSSNPVFLLPAALAVRAEAIGREFIGSLTNSAGQFCTNPGLVVALKGPDLDRFLHSSASVLSGYQPSPMLTPGIHKAYETGVQALMEHNKVETIARGPAGDGPNRGTGALFATDAEDFMADERLGQEVFGASSLVVRCRDVGGLLALTEKLEGQLTATVQMEREDYALAKRLIPILERKAGRILANGWPTGVEVCHAMVHGGPFPATSDSRTTSVGSLAINRFLRPVCYQDLPAELLPEELRDNTERKLPRLVDGTWGG
jgi:alpha-ketoglutaric semialdehyde dehydrogenase